MEKIGHFIDEEEFKNGVNITKINELFETFMSEAELASPVKIR